MSTNNLNIKLNEFLSQLVINDDSDFNYKNLKCHKYIQFIIS